jgi:CheY-like chemotaxis protein
MDKIFEPYFTTKAPGEGTGMGLAVVHGIVKHYEGEITVESKVGRGTKFNVYLPLLDSEIVTEDSSGTEILFGSERILYIDDEIDLIPPVKAMLAKLGYTVTADNSSINALEYFKNNPNDIDLVITDQTMPGMTGKELVAQLKTINPDVPIILCTGYSDQIDEGSAIAMGISAFIFKPFIISDISKTIREVLDGN